MTTATAITLASRLVKSSLGARACGGDIVLAPNIATISRYGETALVDQAVAFQVSVMLGEQAHAICVFFANAAQVARACQ